MRRLTSVSFVLLVMVTSGPGILAQSETAETEAVPPHPVGNDAISQLKSPYCPGLMLGPGDLNNSIALINAVRLKKLPVNEIKIDKSFVMNMIADESDDSPHSFHSGEMMRVRSVGRVWRVVCWFSGCARGFVIVLCSTVTSDWVSFQAVFACDGGV